MEHLDVLKFIDVTCVFERKINLALNYAGLRLPHFNAIRYLATAGKVTVSDLSRAMCVSRATMSVLATQLIKAGVIEAIENRADKRSHYLKLTTLGLNRLKVAQQEVALVEKKISQRLSPKLVETLNQVSNLVIEEL